LQRICDGFATGEITTRKTRNDDLREIDRRSFANVSAGPNAKTGAAYNEKGDACGL
jgi:hypothetical protein